MVRLALWNINLKISPKEDYQRRLANIATRVAELDNARGKRGDVFALVESYFREAGWWNKEFIREKINCPIDNAYQEAWTAACFFDKWRSHLWDSSDLGQPMHGQYGDAAFLTHGRSMNLVGDYLRSTIGSAGSWEQLRYLIGGRFRLVKGDFVFPFYSVHVAPNTSRAPEQCREIVDIITNNFVRGDLTPVVVGDFNFTRYRTITTKFLQIPPYQIPDESYEIMDEWFFEVLHSVGESIVEQCWVGRPSSFPQNGGILSPVNKSVEPNAEFNDHGVNFSDHNFPYVELVIEGTENENLPPWLIPGPPRR